MYLKNRWGKGKDLGGVLGALPPNPQPIPIFSCLGLPKTQINTLHYNPQSSSWGIDGIKLNLHLG